MPEAERIVLSGELSAKWKKLEFTLAQQPSTVVTKCAGEPQEILALCSRLSPCALVIESSLLDRLNPAEFSAAVNFAKSIRVLVEDSEIDNSRVEHFLSLGCSGVLPSSATAREAVRALEAISKGQIWASRNVLSSLLRKMLRSTRHRLTVRESEVLALLTEGLKNNEIAERLFISPQTVRWHLRSLYAKLGTHDRIQAANPNGKAVDCEPNLL